MLPVDPFVRLTGLSPLDFRDAATLQSAALRRYAQVQQALAFYRPGGAGAAYGTPAVLAHNEAVYGANLNALDVILGRAPSRVIDVSAVQGTAGARAGFARSLEAATATPAAPGWALPALAGLAGLLAWRLT